MIKDNKMCTFAVGSPALIERNAANAAVPPPINKYGTSAGIPLASLGSDFGGCFLSDAGVSVN